MKLETWGHGKVKEVFDLDVYRLAEELSDLVWEAFEAWPKKVREMIGHQIIRSSDSIAANRAEGYGRFTPGDRKVFYRYARGSFEETKAWLRKLIRRKVIEGEEIQRYTELINELGPKLNAFIRHTK